MSEATDDALAGVIRVEGVAVVATLTRWVGDLDLAQDCVQDAVERALRTWPRDGIPNSPRAWLTTAARRRAIDIIRRESTRPNREAAAVQDTVRDSELPSDSAVRDDLLRLIFTCCHPALDPAARIALSLRTLGGLSTAEVAAALLTTEPAMQRRIARAKGKIRVAHIPYRIPTDSELPARVESVAATLYLLFNEGYAASSGDALIRRELIAEAIRLARLLHDSLPDEVSVTGLLALMLFQDARTPARVDAAGRLVRLRDQDRSMWRRAQIADAVLLSAEATRRSVLRPNRYAVQAAIAGCHDISPTWEHTPWKAIVSWYDVLLTVDGSPVVALNRAAAVAELDGPEVALAEIDRIDGLDTYPEWHASRAQLLARLGKADEARRAYNNALALESNSAARANLSDLRDRI